MDTEPRRKYRRPQERDYARHDFEGYHAPIGRIAKGFRDSAGVTFDVPLAVEARRASIIVAEACRLVPMAHAASLHAASLDVASLHIPSFHVASISVRSIPVRPISIGSVLVASLPVGPVPIRSAPVLIAVLALEMAFHMKTARAAAMKARTSPRHGFRPRQKHTGEANSGDGDQCSR
jgi:hypothetical protein